MNTPKAERMKRARSVTSDNVGDNEDTRSVSSTQSVGSRTPARKTPSQVKAESAARKAKVETGESGRTEGRILLFLFSRPQPRVRPPLPSPVWATSATEPRRGKLRANPPAQLCPRTT